MEKKERKRTTIYDIAAAASTSAATVSLVLNGRWERHRITSDTALRVEEAARRTGYRANQRARGLRLSRSSLAGMIVPHYRNRFFAGLAEAFEAAARARGLCPVVVSTQRDAAVERSVVAALVAQQVEFLIIAGVDRPDALTELCVAAGIGTVNLDLPGSAAPSVLTDNRGGSNELTRRLIGAVLARGGLPADIRFVGGRADEFATDERVAGFTQALAAFGVAADDRIVRCGYKPRDARSAFEALAAAPGGFPPGVFVNSVTTFESFAGFLRGRADPPAPAVACFDWDPFAAALPIPVIMMRQNVDAMIAACWAIFDGRPVVAGERIFVPPTLADGADGQFGWSDEG